MNESIDRSINQSINQSVDFRLIRTNSWQNRSWVYI